MSCLGLDFGDKTIGVSVSHGKTAVGLVTLKRSTEDAFRPCLRAIKEIIKDYKITKIVLGYPINMDGTESLRCTKTLEFKEKLNRYFKSIPIELWDERLSTRAVSRVFEGDYLHYKKHVDEMAAVYILQGYLDFKNRTCDHVHTGSGLCPPWQRGMRQGSIITNRSEKMENNSKLLPQDNGDETTIVLYDEDGNEIEMEVLSSRIDGSNTYVLVVEEDDEDAEIMHFKLIDDGEDDTIFELVDDDHEDFDRVLELFDEDYKTLGITIDEIEI